MTPLTLAEVAAAVGGTVGGAESPQDVVVSGGASADSRSVPAGGLFVAVVGERVDGHDYAEQAVAAGAAACLAQRDVPVPHVLVGDSVAALGRLARHAVDRLVEGGLVVVGVTGSSGKTSTKDLLAAVLEPLGPTVAPRGSFNTEVGVPITALDADASTQHLVVEMGARGAGHIAYLCRITPPRIGVVLNVGAAHAGEFGSTEATARAKSELVAALPSRAEGGVAVLNADDPLVAAMASVTSARVVRVGRAADADVRAEHLSLDTLGRPTFELQAAGQGVAVTLPLHGAHHVGNALAAAAVALELGATLDQVAGALAAATPRSRWRMEVTERADGVTVVNDAYNANPDSTAAALAALVAMGAGRRSWAVLGEMLELGAASAAEHEAAGRLAVRSGAQRVVAVGDGARPVHTGALAEGAVEGEGSVAVPDVGSALALLRAGVRPGDVVLVKASRSSGLEALAEALLADSSPLDESDGAR
ncbi:MAG: UDP-N-acetylmuramoyl-tripeptide--D-alanyl-D-alanine ligase [Sporichthyaceae bacterium]